ncbi:MAG: PIN domain-containing protein [Acidobacteria bacterium]|nr:PIN domain-containing protein [Acidobacteriota bacterium]
MKGFLLDTNVPSELTYPKPAPQVEHWLEEVEDEQLFFSVISLAEICKGIAKLPESKKRTQLQDWLEVRGTLRPWASPSKPAAISPGRIGAARASSVW